MAILVNKQTRLVIQGITGSAGSFHAKQCIAYGTQVVAGCTPGRGGETFEAEGPDGKNCLLYTSPSPRDRTRSRMPSSA